MPKRSRGDTQQMILDFIREQTNLHGYPPSVREIGEAVGLTSTASVHGHLSRLEKKGLLVRDPQKQRAIAIAQHESNAPKTTPVPLIKQIAPDGKLQPSESDDGTIELPIRMTGEGESFVLTVHGSSMSNIGIMDGDFAVVKRQSEARNGDIVVAMIDGEPTIRRFFRERGHFRLQPETNNLKPIITRSVTIVGIVTSSYRIFQ